MAGKSDPNRRRHRRPGIRHDRLPIGSPRQTFPGHQHSRIGTSSQKRQLRCRDPRPDQYPRPESTIRLVVSRQSGSSGLRRQLGILFNWLGIPNCRRLPQKRRGKKLSPYTRAKTPLTIQVGLPKHFTSIPGAVGDIEILVQIEVTHRNLLKILHRLCERDSVGELNRAEKQMRLKPLDRAPS